MSEDLADGSPSTVESIPDEAVQPEPVDGDASHGDSADSDSADRDSADGDSGQDDPPAPVRVELRQAPKFLSFILAGVVLGVLIAVVALTLWPPQSENQISVRAMIGYAAAIAGLLGGLLGALAAVLADRRS